MSCDNLPRLQPWCIANKTELHWIVNLKEGDRDKRADSVRDTLHAVIHSRQVTLLPPSLNLVFTFVSPFNLVRQITIFPAFARFWTSLLPGFDSPTVKRPSHSKSRTPEDISPCPYSSSSSTRTNLLSARQIILLRFSLPTDTWK